MAIDNEEFVKVNEPQLERNPGCMGNNQESPVAAESSVEFGKNNGTPAKYASDHATAEVEAPENDSLEIEVPEGDVGEEDVAGVAVDAKLAQKQANTYAAKKTVAQGMMDIALITANANQLRYMMEFNSNSPTYYLNIVLITVSLILQVSVGISLIFKGRLDLKGQSKHRDARRINNHVVLQIFLITIINVFIASFTITTTTSNNQNKNPTN